MKLKARLPRYAIKELEPTAATELFCHYAMPPKDASSSLREGIQKIVQACAGLPLALRVMGAALQGNQDNRTWEVRVVD